MPRPYGAGWFSPDQIEIRYLLGEDDHWRVWEWIVSGWVMARPDTRESARRCASAHAGGDPVEMPGWVEDVIEACRPHDARPR